MTTISAKIIADSISGSGKRMTTMEIEYPRFILAELNTHRMLSKNSASSRAIPMKKMHEHIINNMAMPISWGKNQPGMKAKEEVDESTRFKAMNIWEKAVQQAIRSSAEMEALGIHKQIANRLTEAGMTMKTVISGTEWTNLFYLRNHPDAQPEFKELASKMQKAMIESKPQMLRPGEWHLPYVKLKFNKELERMEYWSEEGELYTANEARIVSASCCAQVSYRTSDDSLEKAYKIYKQLIESEPAHASPVEHQATPMGDRYQFEEDTNHIDWALGVSHRDRNGEYWSGNLNGWVQFRKLIRGEAKW